MSATFTVLTFMAALALICAGSPLAHSQSSAEQPKRMGLRLGSAASDRLPEDLQPRTARTERLAEDQREIISKQILQALSEIIQREDCISDYQGWVDFGRRSTD
ncbi:gastrin/cholecystokinin-like peptide [Pygocentrus nattereri]|uniref:gastrin/cholecystokinin-like peptide n=1 Tax=Pygocentrus nattereri TaxID=42514 RepID=UPI000814510E|nr:gastrin/cholecystokinin-like peptide [Pygocentrus nattereri]